MQDGQNLFNDSTSFTGVSWHCAQTFDEMIAAGKMDEVSDRPCTTLSTRQVLAVGVDNTINRTYEYTYSVDKKYGGGGVRVLSLALYAHQSTGRYLPELP